MRTEEQHGWLESAKDDWRAFETLRKEENYAMALDPHYILSRYPNGVGGIPRDYYDPAMIEELEKCAKTLMNFVESKL